MKWDEKRAIREKKRHEIIVRLYSHEIYESDCTYNNIAAKGSI
jgi:hypothetical protein